MNIIPASQKYDRWIFVFLGITMFHCISHDLMGVYQMSGGPNSATFDPSTISGAYYFYASMGSYALGAILGDFILGNKRTLILALIVALFAVVAIEFELPNGVLISLLCSTVAMSMASINLIALLAKSFFDKPMLLAGGITMYFYVSQNSSWLMNKAFSQILHYQWLPIVSGIFLVISISLAILVRSEKMMAAKPVINEPKRSIWLFPVITAIGVLLYELGCTIGVLGFSNRGMASQKLVMENTFLIDLSIITMFIGGAACCIFYSFVRNSWTSRWILGFALAALAYGFHYLIPPDPKDPAIVFIVLGSFTKVLSLCIIPPLVYIVLTKYLNPKYLVSAFAGVLICTDLIRSTCVTYEGTLEESNTALIISFSLFAFLALSGLLIKYLRKSQRLNM